MTAEPHVIFVCTSCRWPGVEDRPGPELINQLRHALTVVQAGEVAAGNTPEFAVSGVACMAGCDRPCTVAFSARDKAAYLFGDIDPQTDIDDLVAFAKQYRELLDGWCNSGTRPDKLRHSALARIPAVFPLKLSGKAVLP